MALATGNCTLVTNAMVYQVMMDAKRNRATGVRYVDRVTRETREIKGRVVVLCAQALESVRILFNSATSQYGDGLANSSGVLGHYLMDHLWVAGGAQGDFPDIPAPSKLGQPVRPNGMYVIRFRNTMNGPRSKDFLRGYGFQGGNSVELSWGAPGVARMGSNPKTSVLNQFQQAHDIDNLFVMDGAGFPSGACQNPTSHDHDPCGPLLRFPHGGDAAGKPVAAAGRVSG